jgi:hypothetical protein
MPIFLTTLLASVRSIFPSRATLELENLALRHPIAGLRRSAAKHLKLTSADRLLWICLSRLWHDWPSALAIVKPETVLAWHPARLSLVLDLEGATRPTGTTSHQRRLQDCAEYNSRHDARFSIKREGFRSLYKFLKGDRQIFQATILKAKPQRPPRLTIYSCRGACIGSACVEFPCGSRVDVVAIPGGGRASGQRT